MLFITIWILGKFSIPKVGLVEVVVHRSAFCLAAIAYNIHILELVLIAYEL